MGFVKMDEGRADHPKLLAAGLAARGLDEAMIEWSKSRLTDGVIPEAAVAMIAAGHGERNWRRLAKRLVEVGRWEATEAGWVIHDFLEWQSSKAHVQAERKATAARVKRHRNGVTSGVTPPVTNGPVTLPESEVETETELRSSSQVIQETPGEPVDDDRIGQAMRTLAERDLERRESEHGRVGDRERWLVAAAQRRLRSHAPRLEALRSAGQLAGLSASELVDVLERPKVVVGASTSADGRTFAPGSGYLADWSA